MKCFKTYITYIYILFSGVENFFWTTYTCLAFKQKHIQNPSDTQDEVLLRVQLTTLRRYLFAQKHSISDAWMGSEYACVQNVSNNVLYHHNKRLMGYFKFLYGSGIICLLLNIPEKFHWQHLFGKPEEAETHCLYLS